MEEEYKTKSTDTPPSGMLDGLLSNPDLLRRIGEIANAVGSTPPGGAGTDIFSTEQQSSPSINGENAHTGAKNAHLEGAPDTTPTLSTGGVDGLSALLSNPAMMEQLPRMMTMLKPMLASMPPPSSAPEAGNKPIPDCRDDLLLALKPFLSAPRRDAVDSILRIAKLGLLLKQLK